jgi:hypothetical protein
VLNYHGNKILLCLIFAKRRHHELHSQNKDVAVLNSHKMKTSVCLSQNEDFHMLNHHKMRLLGAELLQNEDILVLITK